MSWTNDSWLALRGSSVQSFPFRMSTTVNCDNREVVLSDFALCVCQCEFQLYIKSFAVDKLLAATVPKP